MAVIVAVIVVARSAGKAYSGARLRRFRMKPLPKLLTWVATLVFASLFVLVAVLGWLSRDIPAPDTSDLVPEKVELPAAQNAFTHFVAADKPLHWSDDFEKAVNDFLADKPADEAMLRGCVARKAATFEEVQLGLECQRCITPESDSAYSTAFMMPFRRIGRLLALKARLEQRAGDHAGATSTCVSLLQFGNLIQRDADSLIFWLPGTVQLNHGLAAARSLLADPALPPADLARLATALDQLGPFDQSFIRAAKGEFRVFAEEIDRGGWLDSRELDQATKLLRKLMPGYLFQPNRTKLGLANVCREMIRVAPLDYASMNRKPEDPPSESRLKYLLRPNRVGWEIAAQWSSPHLLEKKFRLETEVAATRLLAACRAYQLAEGRLPDTLAALVPKCLPAVPSDPFDGKPFRYRPDPGVIYSVGKDLKDSGGSQKLPSGGKYRPTLRWDAEDAVFELNPPPPEPAKTTR